MASMASQRDATRAPPPPDQLASFHSLVDKLAKAGALCRYARAAELSARAPEKAEALFTADDSLVVAYLWMNESKALVGVAVSASDAEQQALQFRRSWSALLSVVALLQRRITANTLLPGTVRKEESDFCAHLEAAMFTARNKPVPPPDMLQAVGSALGYTGAAQRVVQKSALRVDGLSAALAGCAAKGCGVICAPSSCFFLLLMRSQALHALDVIPQSAGFHGDFPEEADLFAFITKHLTPQTYEPAFCAAVLRKWRSDAVSSVLRARGVLQAGIATAEQINVDFDSRQREDIAKHGLRNCALPSCAKTAKTVKEFAHCSGCRSVVYCCAEHQGLHWTKHKKACNKKQAEQLAAEMGAAAICRIGSSYVLNF